MFYNGSKIRGRSTELVGALFKGPRLKLLIGGAILLAVAVTATMAGIFTNISEAQTTNFIGFNESVQTVNEGELYTYTILAERLLPAGDTATVNLRLVEGTAQAGTHFNADQFTNGVITHEFNENDRGFADSAATLQDNALNGPRVKNFFLELSFVDTANVPPNVQIDPNRNRKEIRIIDDDNPAKIGFENSTYEVIENREMVTLTVKNLGGEFLADSTATVRVSTRDDSALAGTNGDYIATTREIQLSSQTPEVEVTIPIVDDEDEEKDKRFIVDLDVVGSLPFAVELASRTTAAVEIKDGDATIGFMLQSYLVLENGGQREVEIEVKSGKLAEPVTVRLTTEPGTAQPGPVNVGDYVHTEEDLVLSSTQRQDAAVIPINLDFFVEGTERFYAVLSDAGLPKGVKLATGFERAEVAISDEIILTIGFEDAPYSVSEGAGGETITIGIISEGVTLGKEIKVGYEITINGVEASEDLQVTTGTVTFEVSDNEDTRRDVWIPVIDDSRIEIDEIFEVKLSTLTIGPDQPALQLNPGTANFTVTDNERVPVGFGSPRYGVFEDDGVVRVAVNLLDPSLLPTGYGDVDVNYRIEAGSAVAGVDYTDMSGMVTLSAADPRKFIEISIMDDNVPEAHESFRLVLVDNLQIEFAPGGTLVEILNDDIAIIGHAALSGNAEPENTGRISYDLISNIPVPSGVTLTVSTIAGSATEGDDYVPLDMVEVSFQAGAQVQSIPFVKRVIINDDDLFENDLETFFVVLSAPAGGLPPGVELDPTRLRYTVDIEDNETARVVFVEDSYEVNEDAGTVDVEIGFEDGVMLGDNLNVTVYYGITQAFTTATAGEDYELATRDSVVLTALNSRATVSIPILNDDLYEGDEAFAIALLGSSHPRVKATGDTEVTIKDDDSVTVGFIGPASYTVNEGDGLVAIGFGVTAGTLADDSSAEISVVYFSAADTALRGR